jgi:hypothetical protein
VPEEQQVQYSAMTGWLKLSTVTNRTAHGLWVGLESLLLLAVPIGLAFWFLTK